MIGQRGSLLWLLGNEMRLSWRAAMARRAARGMIWIIGIAVVALLIVGVPLGLFLRGVSLDDNPAVFLIADAVCAMVFTLMLSQTLASAIEALYTRDDFDLLLSSPMAPRKVLFVRFLALAASAFIAFAAFIAPILLPVVVLGHPAWLAVLLVLAALALSASALGLWLAMLLFRLIGPRRTRAVAQVLAAIIGAAFFLVGQTYNILGRRTGGVAVLLFQYATDHGRGLPAAATWAPRAMLGEPVLLAAIAALSLAFFAATSWRLGERFVANAAAASGADTPTRATRRKAGAFTAGLFAATLRKELRLLGRDIALLAQVLLRVLYMLPLAFVLYRNASSDAAYLLPGGIAILCVMSGQVASSLAWITVSAEDAPGLLVSAPVSMATVRRAKLTAAMIPLAILLAAPLIGLTVLSPAAGIAASLGCAGAAWSAGLIVAWRQPPGKRSDFRRRRPGSGSLLAGLAIFFINILVGAAAAMASLLWIWAAIPAVLALVLVLSLRRSDAQMTAMLQSAA